MRAFLMMRVDVRITSGNFFITIFMQFLLKRNRIQIHMVYPLLTVQFRLFQNSSHPDVTPSIAYLLLLLET